MSMQEEIEWTPNTRCRFCDSRIGSKEPKFVGNEPCHPTCAPKQKLKIEATRNWPENGYVITVRAKKKSPGSLAIICYDVGAFPFNKCVKLDQFVCRVSDKFNPEDSCDDVEQLLVMNLGEDFAKIPASDSRYFDQDVREINEFISRCEEAALSNNRPFHIDALFLGLLDYEVLEDKPGTNHAVLPKGSCLIERKCVECGKGIWPSETQFLGQDWEQMDPICDACWGISFDSFYAKSPFESFHGYTSMKEVREEAKAGVQPVNNLDKLLLGKPTCDLCNAPFKDEDEPIGQLRRFGNANDNKKSMIDRHRSSKTYVGDCFFYFVCHKCRIDVQFGRLPETIPVGRRYRTQ